MGLDYSMVRAAKEGRGISYVTARAMIGREAGMVGGESEKEEQSSTKAYFKRTRAWKYGSLCSIFCRADDGHTLITFHHVLLGVLNSVGHVTKLMCQSVLAVTWLFVLLNSSRHVTK